MKSKIPVLLFATLLSLCPASGSAATANDDFVAQMSTDYQLIADYVNSQFTKSMGLFNTLGWHTPPVVFDMLGSPKVEIGVGGGADFIGISSINNLQLQALVGSSNVNFPSVVPIPFPVGTARVGLVNGLDLGFKLGYLPLISLPDFGFSADYLGWGLDLRYRILDGLELPTVTVGVSWDTMKGNVSVSTNVNQRSTYTDPNDGLSYDAVLSGTTVYALNWDVKTFGAHLTVGKNLGMVYPFAGVGFSRHSGSVSSTVSGAVTETVSGPLPAMVPIGSSTQNVIITSQGRPNVFEPKFTLGFDLGEGLKWAVVGESNGTDVAGSTSFRIQF